ncbi:mersacidin/lichenicidin family type 2 lantibiotic [Dactylosporangium sp. CA-233914]|uniref:mersacidin/lichenicidin family type 2 lantibiotic n=1 Tax=Dactylosporangium sp. CA-233914 TaxID=3239934 RepID=UPI003D8AEF69
MNTITEAWKNPVFRATLSDTELAALPASPAGTADLSVEQLDGTAGGTAMSVWCATVVICLTLTLARQCTAAGLCV